MDEDRSFDDFDRRNDTGLLLDGIELRAAYLAKEPHIAAIMEAAADIAPSQRLMALSVLRCIGIHCANEYGASEDDTTGARGAMCCAEANLDFG